MRDSWLSIDRQLASDKRNIGQIRVEIEDANEMLFFIADVYSVVEHPRYHHMLTSALIKLFYASVVVQSLAVFSLKPKLSIQTALYVLG